jgi:Dolichyl-phosphate-mannose-protein mannosyltransferase
MAGIGMIDTNRVAGGIIRGAMADPVLPSIPQTSGPGPFPRAWWPWLALLLAIHAGIVVWAVMGPLTTPRSGFRPAGFIQVTLISLAFFGIAFAVRGRYTRSIAWSGAIVVASMLLTPAVTLVVGLQLLNSFVLGQHVLARANPPGASAEPPRFAVATLTGIALWIGLMCATASLKVHYATVYAAALILPLLFWWRTAASALGRAGRLLVHRGPIASASERAWTALLMTMVMLHLFVVAKPETGYDAVAMHLQIPLLMADAHRWPFDVTRYIWAVMPLGADWAFTAANFVGGEGATRFLNFCFAGIAGYLLYDLIRLYARRDIALASVCLLASTPLAFLETGTLFVENLWVAFLLGTLLLALDYLRTKSTRALVALAILAAGAMQCKVIGVIWLAPLLAGIAGLMWRRRGTHAFTGPQLALLAVAAAIAVWPYANAWLRTGNPVFPFMNALFRSPLFDTTTSFNNWLYNAPLRPWSPYELVWSSGRFIEGADGAAGFQWLLLFPVIVLAFMRWRPLAQWLALGLAVVVFVGVYSQQSYLRYLLPYFALVALLGGWTLSEIPDGRATRAAILLVGGLLCLANVRLMYTASWSNATLCTSCSVDGGDRREYVAQYKPDRIVADYLNQFLPNARVGFYMLGAPSPAGFVGYSRAANWHDYPTFRAITMAQTADDVLAVAKMFSLTHIVYRDPPDESENDAMRAFRERYTVPVWRGNGMIIAAIGPASDH